VHGGCDRQRCYEDTWLLELPGDAYNPDNKTVAEARWRQLQPQPQPRGGPPSLSHGAVTGGVRGHACVAHGSWLVVHGGCDLAGRCSSDVRVLEVERTATTGKAPHGGAGRAHACAGRGRGRRRRLLRPRHAAAADVLSRVILVLAFSLMVYLKRVFP